MREPRVSIRQFDAIHSPSALWHSQTHFVAALLRKPLGEQLRLFHFERKQNLRRNEKIVLVVALHDFAEEVARSVVGDFFPKQLSPIDDVSVANHEELSGDVATFFVQAPNVDIFLLR